MGSDGPIIISVEMKGTKVDILQMEDGGKVFTRGAIVVEVPIVASGAVVEEAVAAKGDHVALVYRFDVLAHFVSPGGQDLAAVAVCIFAPCLQGLVWQAVLKMFVSHIPRWQAPMQRLRESLCIL